jgi:PAS domain-containing protein
MDITTTKQVEEKIRQREAELRQILDLTPQVVGVYGLGGERLLRQPLRARIHGYWP